jgi:hypothetical protein
MDVDAALDFAEERFFAQTGERFNDLQKQIFKGAWQGLTYEKIADFLDYNDSHIKEEGARLCQLLSEALGEKVTKLKFRAPLERGWRTQQSRNTSSPHPSVVDRIQPSAPDPTFVERESAIANSSQPVSSSAPAQKDYNETRQRGVWIPNNRCRQVWGRENLIEQILNRLDDPQELCILSLSGGAGYGKTEAASQIAKTVLNRNLFADVLWVTARQTELVDGSISQEQRCEVLNWNKFLHEIAHQLACPVERVQQCLREEKLLVVLDNAETADVEGILSQLVPMLNPSRALLTSRLKTKPPYVGLIPIPGLEERWSHRLLRNEAECNDIPVLLQASNEQLHRVHQLSCGAPLALHFVVGRVLHDNALDPVLSELEQASGRVEVFYRFCLETAWQRITDTSKEVLRYVGAVDAGVTKAELSGAWKLLDSNLNAALAELRRWYLLEDKQDVKGNWRYDLHPWVRGSVRGGLVDNWQPSLQDLEQITRWKYDL